jgi:hypothetical protein
MSVIRVIRLFAHTTINKLLMTLSLLFDRLAYRVDASQRLRQCSAAFTNGSADEGSTSCLRSDEAADDAVPCDVWHVLYISVPRFVLVATCFARIREKEQSGFAAAHTQPPSNHHAFACKIPR